MANLENRKKQNPKLQQSELSDGRASLYLEYYLGRTESPVLDEDGNQVFYTDGAMAGKPKYKIKHSRKKENLNLYIWLHPRNQQERMQNKNTLALAEKIRFEREQSFWRTGRVIVSARIWMRTFSNSARSSSNPRRSRNIPV